MQPLRSACYLSLHRPLAAKTILDRHGFQAILKDRGLAKDVGKFEAHAWIRVSMAGSC